MDEFSRILEIERGVLNMETGEFPMIAASEGEATDGDILRIAGLEMPERMPLLFRHTSTPTIPALGSVTPGEKTTDVDGVPVQRAFGRFNLNGDDPLAGIRRGMAQLVHDGDMHAVSLKWNARGVSRASLPATHQHRADRGLFFEQSRAREVSIVEAGADPRAVMGRADAAAASGDSLGGVFFRALASTPQEQGMASLAGAFSALNEAREAMTTAGVSADDLLRLLEVDGDEQLVRISYGDGASVLVPQGAADALQADANHMMREAFDLAVSRVDVPDPEPTGSIDRSDAVAIPVQAVMQEAPAFVQREQEGPKSMRNITPREFAAMLGTQLESIRYKRTGRK